MTLTIIEVKGNADLYHRYPGQLQDQDVYVELDCDDETLAADWNGEIGNAVPMSVWHGRTLRWSITSLRAGAANLLLKKIAPLAERVIAGYSVEWDGNNNVGQYTPDAQTACEEIARLCYEEGCDYEDQVNVMTAEDFLYNGIGGWKAQCLDLKISATMTDDELSKIGETLENEAMSEGVDELTDVESHLEWLREKCQEQTEEE